MNYNFCALCNGAWHIDMCPRCGMPYNPCYGHTCSPTPAAVAQSLIMARRREIETVPKKTGNLYKLGSARRSSMLEKLAKLWDLMPDYDLGELLDQICIIYNSGTVAAYTCDPELESAIDAALEHAAKRG